MLAIRLQRVGRSGLAQYRIIVQDSKFHPTREKIVERVGSYDPHTKACVVNKEAVEKYLNNGAQPSDRLASILLKEGVKLPKWVKVEKTAKKKTVKNSDKLRKNQPKEEPKVEEPTTEEVSAEPVAEESATPETTENK